MNPKRLEKKQCANILTLVQTLCDTQFAFVHYAEDLINSSECLCQLTMDNPEPLELFDLHVDSRCSNARVVRENPHLNYYYGVSLRTAYGEILGTLCIYKSEQQPLDTRQKSTFKKIAKLASELIDTAFAKEHYFNQLTDRDKKLVQLFEQSTEALMTIEPPNWCFSSGNPAALALFNVSTEEAFKQLGPWAVSPEYQPDGSSSRDKAKKFVIEALENGVCSFEWVHQALDGRTFPCSVILNRIVEGHRNYLQATVRDISEEKMLRDGLKSQLAINKGILDSTNEGILLVDHESRKIQSHNARFLEMWDIPQSLIDSQDDIVLTEHVLLQLKDPELFVGTIEKLYANPHEESFDTLYFNDDRVVDRYSTPYICEGELRGRLWFFRDVTDIRVMERLVNQSSRLASIGQLAAGIGHEINNPLTIISGYLAKIMQNTKNLPKVMQQDLNKIHSAGERIENIVGGLRSFANIEKSAPSESFNLKALFFEIENMLKGIYLKDGITLMFDHSALTKNVAITGDRGKFEQVLINLISNAKDSTAGLPNRIIEVTVNAQQDDLCVSVCDNGVGISSAIKDKIFDPFFTTKGVGKGTGIGLALVYRFVTDEFNGHIEVHKSGLGNGSRFDLTFPFVKCIDASSKPLTSELDRVITMRHIRVILAEDEHHIRDLLYDFLSSANIEVYCCEDGAQALQEYLNNPAHYDLVISDVKMPVMDGLMLLRKIREQVDLPQPKFFLTTGGINVDFDNTDNELQSMIDGYLYKPFNLNEVHAQIQKMFPETSS